MLRFIVIEIPQTSAKAHDKSMIALLPKDILTYVYRLVHYDLVQNLIRQYTSSIGFKYVLIKAVDTSSGVRFYNGFLFNYRHIYNGSVYQYNDTDGIYNVKDCRRVAALSKNYIYTPIYTN